MMSNWSVIGGPRGMLAPIRKLFFVLFVSITFAVCAAESTGFEDVSISHDLADRDGVSEGLLALLFSNLRDSDAQEIIPLEPEEPHSAPRLSKRNADFYQEEDQKSRKKRQATERGRESEDGEAKENDFRSWWWPFLTVRRSPFSPRLGKRGEGVLADRDFATEDDDDDLSVAEYLGDDLQDFLTEGKGSSGLVDKKGMGFSPRLGKRAPDFAFSPRLGKKSSDLASPSDKRGGFAFSPRLGKRADFAFSPRLGKRGDFAFSPRLGKRGDFAFSPRLGKKADFAFSPRLGKRGDFAFVPRLGKRAGFSFTPRLGKRKSESTQDTKNNSASSPRLSRAYFSPRLG